MGLKPQPRDVDDHPLTAVVIIVVVVKRVGVLRVARQGGGVVHVFRGHHSHPSWGMMGRKGKRRVGGGGRLKWRGSYRCQEMRRASLPITIIILIIAIVSELNVPSAVPRLTPGTEWKIIPNVLRKDIKTRLETFLNANVCPERMQHLQKRVLHLLDFTAYISIQVCSPAALPLSAPTVLTHPTASHSNKRLRIHTTNRTIKSPLSDGHQR